MCPVSIDQKQTDPPSRYTIDCGADPFIPDGFSLVEHIGSGLFEWDPASPRVSLYFPKLDASGRFIEKEEVLKGVGKLCLLNANMLDLLLASPFLYPEEWKKETYGHYTFICFWGTTYRNGGVDYIRSLYYNGESLRQHLHRLDRGFDANSPIAVMSDCPRWEECHR